MFLVSVPCHTVGIFVKQPGYRPQYLPLDLSALKPSQQPITIIVPLLPVDKQDINKPYLQTEQTHIEQQKTVPYIGKPQPNQFTIVDALTNRPLTASVCFFFTKTGRRHCTNTPNGHPIIIPFAEPDIVAVDITAVGYQPYQGNLIVDELDDKIRQHVIRLTRALTLLSVQSAVVGNHYVLYPSDGGSPIPLAPVPGSPSTLITYTAQPGSYTLTILDATRLVRQQQLISLTTGLNSLNTEHIFPSSSTTVSSNRNSLPVIYFDQSSFTLRPEAKLTLLQLVTYLTQHPNVQVFIIGHTDAEGDERLNQILSEHRAKVVSSFLFSQGIADSRMKLSGCGSHYAIASNDSEALKARNRRVQLRLVPE
nr:OmpA family protein [uncultured Spirosoma sp.]